MCAAGSQKQCRSDLWNDKDDSRNIGSTGSSHSHNHSFTGNPFTFDNNPPYITVYCYKRTN